MLRAGLDLDARLLALVCASHSGEAFHLEGVREILATGDMDPEVLQTPAGWPLDDVAREEAVRAGRPKTPLAMNCSGKHAGMIITALRMGADPATYRDPDHPMQIALVQTVDDLAGEQAVNLAVDGCGAPAYATRSTAWPGPTGGSAGPLTVRRLRWRRRCVIIRSTSRGPGATSSRCIRRSRA